MIGNIKALRANPIQRKNNSESSDEIPAIMTDAYCYD